MGVLLEALVAVAMSSFLVDALIVVCAFFTC